MPEMTREEAVQRMCEAVRGFDALNLMEVYNEVFPKDQVTLDRAQGEPEALAERLVQHITSGLNVSELMDLWWLIFTRDHSLWYDEEADRIHYTTRTEPVTGP